MTDDAKREKDASRVDTVRPPAGGDAYNDQTVVRTVPPELLTISKGAPRPRPKKEAAEKAAPPAPTNDDAEAKLQVGSRQKREIRAPAQGLAKLYEDDDDEASSSEAAVVNAPSPHPARPKRKGFDLDLVVVFIFAMIAVLFLGWIAGRP